MFRIWLVSLLTALICLTGCGGQPQNPPVKPDKTENPKATCR